MFDREEGRIARAEISAYDGIHAELCSEKEERARKFMRTHKVRNDGASVKKDAGRRYIKEMEYRMDSWVCKHGCDMISHYRALIAEESVMDDWKLEQRNHEDAMRIIRRIDSLAEFVAESYEPVNNWFMDSDIGGWTYADGSLCYGARDRIGERLYYQAELDAYIAESRKLYADEQYYREQVSFGIPARYYVR